LWSSAERADPQACCGTLAVHLIVRRSKLRIYSFAARLFPCFAASASTGFEGPFTGRSSIRTASACGIAGHFANTLG
jgi:hypothetical protein